MSAGISTPNLPPSSAPTEVLCNAVVGGRAVTVRVPIGVFSNSVTAASIAVFATTKAVLDGLLDYPAGAGAYVLADSDTAKRGVYIKSGAAGTGSWGTKVADLLVGPAGAPAEMQIAGGFLQYRTVGALTWINLTAVSAITGAKGEKGDQGAKGDKGDQGAQGATGATGATGAAGAKGDKGDQGAQGPAGAKGDQGAQGAAGPAGAQGSAGPAGSKGDTGSQGGVGRDGGLYSYHHPGIGTSYFTLDAPEISTAASRELDASGIVATTSGPAYRLTNQGTLRSRQLFPVEATQVYLERFVWERVSTVDPSGDAIAVGVICYAANGSVIQQVNLQLWDKPAAGTRVDVTFAFTPVEGADALPAGIIRLPAGTVRVSTFTRTYGGQQDTRVRVQGFDMQGAGSGDASSAAAAAYAADANNSKNAAAQFAAQSLASAQSVAQLVLGFTTLALLNADTASPASSVKQVTNDGDNTGVYVRNTSNSPPWSKLAGVRTLPQVDRALALFESGVKAVPATKGFEKATDPFGFGWRRYDLSDDGNEYLMGGSNRAGLPVVHDGLGTAESNYKVAIPDSVPLAQVATTAKFAETARGFEKATDPFGFGWQLYRVSDDGNEYLIGGVNRLGITVVHDGLGTTEEHYLPTGGTGTVPAASLASLPLVGISGTNTADIMAVGRVLNKLSGPNPPNPIWSRDGKPAYARPPFKLLVATPENVAKYGQFEARGCFGGERWGTQTLACCYGSDPVPDGVNPEGRGRGTVYRVNGNSKVLDPVLFLIPDNYPDGPSYCNNVHLFRLPWPDGRALLTCPVAGGGGNMTAYAFILHNPETVGVVQNRDKDGNLLFYADGTPQMETADVGPPCIIGYGWCGIPSRSFGTDLLMMVSTIVDYETGKGLMLKRLYLFGERNDLIHAEPVATLPNAPQDVPIEQGVVKNTFYEPSMAALPAERPGDPPSGGAIVTMRAESGVGEAGGQFWTRSFARMKRWELPFRPPFPTVGAQTELTNDPDGALIFAFNRSKTERRDLCVAIHIGGDVALRSSWVETVIDPRGWGATPSISYYRLFFPEDQIGRWMSNKPVHIWGDMGRNKDGDGPDPAVPGKYRGWGMLYTINKADLLKGVLTSLTITEYPTHQPV